jgi:hypothetical protein
MLTEIGSKGKGGVEKWSLGCVDKRTQHNCGEYVLTFRITIFLSIER